jgi:HSP20 family protein
MPTIIRKSLPTLLEGRREVFRALTWHVRASAWNPPTDIYETEEYFIVRVEIAGIRDEDLEVAMENNVLMISGQRSDINERRAYHQMEIRFGKFEISVEVPTPVEVENAGAEYRDGMLMIRLPKTSPKNIKVK